MDNPEVIDSPTIHTKQKNPIFGAVHSQGKKVATPPHPVKRKANCRAKLDVIQKKSRKDEFSVSSSDSEDMSPRRDSNVSGGEVLNNSGSSLSDLDASNLSTGSERESRDRNKDRKTVRQIVK